ncbi:MAG TPA: (Fe-S)-binding protein [Gaiellaceae bacterium]
MRVTLFVPCYADTLAPSAAIATVTVLERAGHEVVYPEEQTCCGQMHANSGYLPEALRLAERFVGVFSEADIVVAPSASCVGTVRHLYPRMARRAGDDELADRAKELGAKVFELSEALTGPLEAIAVGSFFPHRVTYHPTCHSLRALRVGDRPLELLEAVEGLELVPLPRAEECCGFGGTFAVKNPDTSAAMLADKVAAVEEIEAEACVALDGSCLLQIGGGLGRAGSKVRALHLAEILAATAET